MLTLTAGVDVKLSGAFRGSSLGAKYVNPLINDIESNVISSAVYGTPLNMSDLAAGYVQDLAQNVGEQLKDALDKSRQLDQAHYREAQAAARGNKYFGDSPSHKNILASASQRARTAAMERTLPKGEVNEEAILRDLLLPSDMELAIEAELAKVDQEILGGRNESRWTRVKEFLLPYATEEHRQGIKYPGLLVTTKGFGKAIYNTAAGLVNAAERGLEHTYFGPALEVAEAITGKQMQLPYEKVQGGELYGAAGWDYFSLGATAVGGVAGLAGKAAGLASRFAMFGRAAEIGEVGAEVGEMSGSFSKMNPADIKFSQSSVSPYFGTGGRVDDLVNQMRAGNITPNDLPPIRVVDYGGKMFSLDNRRLLAFNLAGIDEIPVNVVSLDNKVLSNVFKSRFDPIVGEGNLVAVATRVQREMTERLMYENDLIRGINLGY